MLNNFIYAKTKALFLELLDAGNILDEAIVFIEDTKEIWNHGTYFGASDLSTKADKTELANYLPLTGGTISGDLDVTSNITTGYSIFAGLGLFGSVYLSETGYSIHNDSDGLTIMDKYEDSVGHIIVTGNGNQYLSNNGSYNTIKTSELTNDSDFVTSADIENKADKATTLAGYGIEDTWISTIEPTGFIGGTYFLLMANDSIYSSGLKVGNRVSLIDGSEIGNTDMANPYIKPIYVPYASTSQLGVVKIGDNLTVDSNGVLSASAVPTKLSDLEDDLSLKEFKDFYRGVNTSFITSSIPIDKHLAVCSLLGSDVVIRLKNIPEAGTEIQLILKNTETSDYTLTFDSTYVNLDGDSITVPVGGYAKVNIISDGTTCYTSLGYSSVITKTLNTAV